ncbi:MAG: UDP-N-acetylmuramoyl-L-alanyl-D-glutamate--2,6-diaminopimelate ligase [Gammaproteobacteria bacterium]|nr:UDP-N-acetylmuramoyl-L-alanyl-D-glutamate--2,6-diaminopimelate ligase [Gammaproteobacteria bacterium]|tara:strand:+ start:207 stop:1709 length:1503 start_codon:yes stop_codon:yes gene_type:complete
MSLSALNTNASHSLSELMDGFADAPEVYISGITSDSRQVKKGFLFLACRGINNHGLDYLKEAIKAGASAVAWDSSTAIAPTQSDITLVNVENLIDHLGEIANRFYEDPSKDLKIIGITGTNGKTTTAWLLKQCLHYLENCCAYVGTLGSGINKLKTNQGLTTPAVIELHGQLSYFVNAGAKSAVIEISSHSLSQGRVSGIEFDAAIFTNMTQDHLDYHGDMQSYFDSKSKLFLECNPKIKIINIDSDYGMKLAALCNYDVIIVSTNPDMILNKKRFVMIQSFSLSNQGSEVVFSSSWGEGKFKLSLPGFFNIENAATVIAYLLAVGFDIKKVCYALSQAEAPSGRMQKLSSKDRTVYVDYAHTPDAIKSALKALRPHCFGKLWCVFGCGGDRDKGKRPLMAKIAEQFSDHIVVTSDNPRSESSANIIKDILSGFKNKNIVTVIEDRSSAITWAISNASNEDIILIAGKGDEDYQEINGDRRPFSDAFQANLAINLLRKSR